MALSLGSLAASRLSDHCVQMHPPYELKGDELVSRGRVRVHYNPQIRGTKLGEEKFALEILLDDAMRSTTERLVKNFQREKKPGSLAFEGTFF